MGNPVTWFDLGAADEGPLRAFYAELFGWKLQRVAETYTTLSTGGGINGGIGRSQSGDPWLAFYVEVADPQAMLDRAVSLGGNIALPVTEVPDVVTFAMFNDPDGLLIGLIKTRRGVEGAAPSDGEGAAVDWFEILGPDTKRSQAFYGDLFGWSFNDAMTNYAPVDTGNGTGISGAVGSGGSRKWTTVYAAVDDVERCLARAEEMGGTREYGPIDVGDHLQTGAIRDPAGNLFGVYHHAPH